MSKFVVSGSNKSFDPAPADNHVGVCDLIVNLGDQPVPQQFAKTPGEKRPRMYVRWLLVDTEMSDGRPYSIGQYYTPSLERRSNLRKALESWRGRKFTDAELEGFDLSNVLGKACMVNVTHKQRKDGDGVFAQVEGIAKLPKGMKAPKLPGDVTPVIYSPDDHDQESFDLLPDWIKEAIQAGKGHGYGNQAAQSADDANAAAMAEEFDDDIPF